MPQGLMERDLIPVNVAEFYEDELERNKCVNCEKIFYVVKAYRHGTAEPSFLNNYGSAMLCVVCRKEDKKRRNKFSIPFADSGGE